MTRADIEAKALDLIGSVYGEGRAAELVRTVMELDSLSSVRDLGRLLADA